MKCRMITLQKMKSRYGTEKFRDITSVCKRTARVFYRVVASGPTSSRYSPPTNGEIFGFCDECYQRILLNGWQEGWGEGTVRGFHGKVVSTTAVTEQEAQENRKNNHDEYIKHQFKKLFRLKQNQCIPLERWPELMQDSIQEWVIESVQGE
jgi:hypothetical protein